MNKKHLSLLLALVLVLGVVLTACGGKDKPAEPAEPTENGTTEGGGEEAPTTGGEIVPGTQIIIGNSTELSGDWSELWQNGAADYEFILAMRNSIVHNDAGGEYHINPSLVKDYTSEENEDGSKTYTITLQEGLLWQDGSPITAKNFVSGYLLWASPTAMEVGAPGNSGDKLVGYKEYNAGESKEFAGIRLIDDLNYSVTVAADRLPFYYELNLIANYPEDINFWTGDDEIDVADDGNGIYLTKDLTAEEHGDNILAARHTIPRPTSGAYGLVEYDSAAKIATAKANPNYAGNWEGKKPTIETMVMKKINKDTQFDELKTGAIDVILQSSSGDEIKDGLDLVDQGIVEYFDFPRAGYGHLSFVCDFGPTQFVEVRQAIAHLLDRVDFANSFTGGYGSLVHGPYGEAQWMYQESKKEFSEKLNDYAYNPAEAVKILEEGGWTLNETGGEYTEGIRYKDVDGELMPLIIRWASSENNEVSDLLAVKLQENPDLAAAGIKIEKDVMTFPELLNYKSRDGGQDAKYAVPTYHMFNLATNFPATVESNQYNYNIDEQYMGGNYNSNFIRDQELSDLGVGMVKVDPENRDEFRQLFVDFCVRWNELLPNLPLYSNQYHDFYNARIENFTDSPYMRLWETVTYANIAE